MKKLFFLFILMGCLFPLHAQKGSVPAGLEQKIEAQIASRHPTPAREKDSSQPSRETRIEQELRRAIQAPINKQSLLSWQEFKQKNAALQQSLAKRNYTGIQSVFGGTGSPDYVKEIRPVQYIYVSDASDHETFSIPSEVEEVMRAIRTVYPVARILLASEFFVRTDPNELPFRRAGSTTHPSKNFVFPSYHRLLPLSDQLRIDILGLDDHIFSRKHDAYKMGNMWVKMTDLPDHLLASCFSCVYGWSQKDWRRYLDDFKQAQQNLHSFYQQFNRYNKKEQEEILSLDPNVNLLKSWIKTRNAEIQEIKTGFINQLLDISNWGIEQRNNQWAKRIEALAPFYDFIIVYGGNGHLDPASPIESVPEKIGKPGVLFNFYTQEKLSQKRQDAYEKRDLMLLEQGLWKEPPCTLQIATEDWDTYSPNYSIQFLKEYIHKETTPNHVIYAIRMNSNSLLSIFDVILPDSTPHTKK